MSIITSISRPDFVKTIFGPNIDVKIDVKTVAVAGHSFGGITALQSGIYNAKVKAVISLDPWFLPVHKLVMDKTYKL